MTAMVDRKIHAMHKRYGIDWENTCKGCSHLISGEWHDKHYHKCKLYGMSHSEATDWRRSWIACGMFNKPMDIELFTPVMKTLSRRREPESQLEGQMDFSSFLSESTN